MPATTYLNPAEHLSPTSNLTLNSELSQLIRATGKDWRVAERKRTHRRWWGLRKPDVYLQYTLYMGLGGVEFQIVNFWLDHHWSINHSVDAEVLIAYMMGITSGVDHFAKMALVESGAVNGMDPHHPFRTLIAHIQAKHQSVSPEISHTHRA